MAAAKKSTEPKEPGDIYGLKESKPEVFSTGCTLLDCALGGGWAVNRFANVVGDSQTGKTLLAIEACANFAAAYPDGRIIYVEAESAFDEFYAESLGLPHGRVELVRDIDTVESLFEDIRARLKDDIQTLYIVDSLDALGDRAEKERDLDKGSYGMAKQKLISTLFRQHIQDMRRAHFTLMVVSQVRENIGVTFGETKRRSGGKALDFYASQIVWLAHRGQISVMRKGVKRPIGVKIKAKVKKNKIGPPFREADFPLYFTFGVEDVEAGLEWLVEVKQSDAVGLSEDDAKKLAKRLGKLSDEEYATTRADVRDAVIKVWADVESNFAPTRRKYG